MPQLSQNQILHSSPSQELKKQHAVSNHFQKREHHCQVKSNNQTVHSYSFDLRLSLSRVSSLVPQVQLNTKQGLSLDLSDSECNTRTLKAPLLKYQQLFEHVFICPCSSFMVNKLIRIRTYFRKIKRPGIERFAKSALFLKKNHFVIQMKLIKNNFDQGGFNLHLSFWIVQVPFCQTKTPFY